MQDISGMTQESSQTLDSCCNNGQMGYRLSLLGGLQKDDTSGIVFDTKRRTIKVNTTIIALTQITSEDQIMLK